MCRPSVGCGLLDHFSIAALGRVSCDSALMVMYLSKLDITYDEWNLRSYVLYLHDLCNRKRFLTSVGSVDGKAIFPFFDNYKKEKEKLKILIVYYGQKCRKKKCDIDALCKGNIVFVDGVRGAVREAGWDVNGYEFFQSYLSAYVHSHPVSFLKAEEHKINFEYPSDFQFAFCAQIFPFLSDISCDVQNRMEVFSRLGGDRLGQFD